MNELIMTLRSADVANATRARKAFTSFPKHLRNLRCSLGCLQKQAPKHRRRRLPQRPQRMRQRRACGAYDSVSERRLALLDVLTYKKNLVATDVIK